MDDGVWPPKPKLRRKDRPLSDEERLAWEQWTEAVRPLPQAAKRSRQQHAALPAGRRPAPLDVTRTASPPHPAGRIGSVRRQRGRREPDAAIDLHGLTIHRAHDCLLHFLELARAQDLSLVLVITGKGAGGVLRRMEPGERMEGAQPRSGLLRALLPLWLKERQFQSLVRGLEQAPPYRGGAGAWLVHLHRKR